MIADAPSPASAHDAAWFEVVPLDTRVHKRQDFTCGHEALDTYLHRRASQDAGRDYARVFVMVPQEQPDVIAGYYTLSSHGVNLSDLPLEIARRLPRYPVVPALLLGRLAVDARFQGSGLGKRLLRDAFRRVLEADSNSAIAVVIVDAIDEAASAFYERFGFKLLDDRKPQYPRRMMLFTKEIRKAAMP